MRTASLKALRNRLTQLNKGSGICARLEDPANELCSDALLVLNWELDICSECYQRSRRFEEKIDNSNNRMEGNRLS